MESDATIDAELESWHARMCARANEIFVETAPKYVNGEEVMAQAAFWMAMHAQVLAALPADQAEWGRRMRKGLTSQILEALDRVGGMVRSEDA